MIIERDSVARTTTVVCENCGKIWLIEDCEIELSPYPHFTCYHCGEWIPMF